MSAPKTPQGRATAPARQRETTRLAAILATLVGLTLATSPARALEGFRCQHTAQCSAGETCVADPLTSKWGTCVRITVLSQQVETARLASVRASGAR